MFLFFLRPSKKAEESPHRSTTASFLPADIGAGRGYAEFDKRKRHDDTDETLTKSAAGNNSRSIKDVSAGAKLRRIQKPFRRIEMSMHNNQSKS